VEAQTYALSRKEAEHRHLDVDATTNNVLAEHLSPAPTDIAGLDQTLDRAARLRAKLPRTADAVALIREGRDELDRRAQRR
jgi:hypothetical protein